MNNSTTKSNDEKRNSRLKHIRSNLASTSPAELANAIANNTGDTPACVLLLAMFSSWEAMLAWFDRQDLDAMRNWWYTSATLTKMRYEMTGLSKFEPGRKALELMAPLLSNCGQLIDWFANTDGNFDLKRVENPKTHDFWAYQAFIALRQDWPRLISRCEKVLADPPSNPHYKKLLLDHQFYLALARGDAKKMSELLQLLVEPKMLKARRNSESGTTGDLISTPGIIFAKLAWRSGFEIDVHSPYIPSEWLPTEPLVSYEKYFSVIQ